MQRANTSKIFGTPEHDKRKEQMKVAARKRCKLFEVEHGGGIALFKREIFEGSFYICDVCNRGLYKRSVIHLSLENYNISHEIFTNVLSYDGRAYICITYHKKLLKVLASCSAVINKLGIVSLPKEFESVNKLERILVSKKILFKKITIMSKGQTPKIKGTICNIPVQETETNYGMFPCLPNSNGIVIVKLNGKLEYKGYVLYEAVRPEIVAKLLTYLKRINPLYKNIGVELNNIPSELKSFHDLDEKKQISIELLKSIYQPIKMILEKNAGNID